MFSLAMTRSTRIGSVKKRLAREPEPLGEPDPRVVGKRLACRRDVGPRVADVSRPPFAVPALHRLAEQLPDRLGDLVHARRYACRDVENPPACPRGVPGAH